MSCSDALRLSRFRRTGHVTPANVQCIAVRGCFGEGLQKARLAVTEEREVGDCEAGDAASRFSWWSPCDAQTCAQRHDEFVAGQ